MLEVPSVPRDDVAGPAGASRGDLHRVLEVGHPQPGGMADRVRAAFGDSHEANQLSLCGDEDPRGSSDLAIPGVMLYYLLKK